MEKPESQTRPIEQPTEILLEQPKERPAQQPRSKKSNLNMPEARNLTKNPQYAPKNNAVKSSKAPSHSGKMLKEPTLNRHDRETQYRKEIIFATTQKSCHSRKS